MASSAIVDQIQCREVERCEALVAGDLTALERLIAPRLVHIHATGVIEDRAAYLATVADRLEFLEVERGLLSIIEQGDCALVSGPLHQVVRNRVTGQTHDMQMVTSQMWVRDDGEWRQASFHATRLANP